MIAAALGAPAPARPIQGPGAEPAFERIHYVIDASGSMRARFGEGTKLDAVRTMVLRLDQQLTAASRPPEAALWAYGARTHRLERDCRDVELVARGEGGVLERALARLAPRGVSPMVAALEAVLESGFRPAREAWVLFTDGEDTCGRDPCEWAARTLARPSRPRIYVIGLGLAPEDARRLACLTEPGSGYVLDLRSGTGWESRLARLAAVIQNRGTLRLEVAARAGRAALTPAPEPVGRVFRVGSTEPFDTIRAGHVQELPGGMYRVVVETVPPTTFERVLVLPGEERILTLENLARLEVRAYSAANEPVAAGATLVAEDDGTEELYLPSWRPAHVRAGRYRLTVEIGDSMALRGRLDLAPGSSRTVTLGGTGFVRARTPEIPDLTGVDVELQSYTSGRTTPVRPWERAVAVPAGEYRAVVRSLPVYVEEGLSVAPAETTAIVVTGLGTLTVDLRDGGGRPLSVPVTLLRPEIAETETGEGESPSGAVIGTFLSGVTQAVAAGIYDILLETLPSRVERGVRVEAGSERVLTLVAPAPPGTPAAVPAVNSPSGESR